jgi:hypothetical protein
MEEATPIAQLGSRDHKPPLDNVSYADLLDQMQMSSKQHVQPPIGYGGNGGNGMSMETPNTSMMNIPSPPPQPSTDNHSPIMYAPPYMTDAYGPNVTNNNPSPPSTNTETVSKPRTKNEDFQNEMIVLLVVYVLIHTDQFQSILRSKIPSMFHTETNTINIFGTVVTGILLVIGWNISRKIVVKYMKEFN